MVAVGLILLLLGVGVGGFLTWMSLQSTWMVRLGPNGFQMQVMPITLFAAGAATVLLIWFGTRLVIAGTRRGRAQRKQLKELKSGAAARGEEPEPQSTSPDKGIKAPATPKATAPPQSTPRPSTNTAAAPTDENKP